MRFGLTDTQWKTVEIILLEPLWKIGATVWIFGSRARGTYWEFSDLDVLFSIPPDIELPMGLLAQISESLEESDLPIKVDLVDEKYLASSYRSGVFKDRIPLLPPRS